MLSVFHRLNAGEAVFDFIGHRKRWYWVSAVLLLLCVGSFIFRGFNFGIEFDGGTQFQFKATTAQPADVQQVAEQAGADVENTPQIVGAGSTRSIVVKAGELTPAEQDKVESALQTRFGQQVNVQAVSSSWGSDITKAAIRGLVFFLIAVCIFIAIRFEWKMAVGAIAALFHDLLLTAGIYSIVGFEVSPSTIVGLLTILGFSLYDTVVVFDKVDENARGILGGSRITYSGAANLAVNQTLMRSINTSLIALLPVAGLLFVGAGLLGVGTIKDLALVLFVGLASGAYSSIFLATPIVCELKEREPKYKALAKRVAQRRAAEARGEAPAGTTRRQKAPARTAAAAATATATKARRGRTAVADEDEDLLDTEAAPAAESEEFVDEPAEAPEAPAPAGRGAGSSTPRPGARPQKRPAQKRGGGGRPSAKKRR
ncbi:MAG TPA: protein translocase subunit SecF [Mycobacteriales bacterium]|nr:protein translocase subunit SecF [Mycobacteriales bacterium]